jgi:hypothetical protein
MFGVVAASCAAMSATLVAVPALPSWVAGLKQPGQPSVQPCSQTTNRAPGPLARLRGSIAWTRSCTRGYFVAGFGTDGVGRTPKLLVVTSISLSKRSGVMMLLSTPPDGTKPSSVPPDSRSVSWFASVGARKL